MADKMASGKKIEVRDYEMEKLFWQYEVCGFKVILTKGYNPQYNRDKDYKTAKQPVAEGFTDDNYKAPTLPQCREWMSQGGWLGWVVPPGYHVVDTEDATVLTVINTICKNQGLSPPVNITNNGRQFVFRTDLDIPGNQEQFTKWGVPVTYRAASKNYVILPPINNRSWINFKNFTNPPTIPDALLPYESTYANQVLRCLSFCVGDAYRNKLLTGYDDLDATYMVFLIENGFSEKEIQLSFQMIFGKDYDERQTESMMIRTKERVNSGKSLRGTGSFLQKITDMKLQKVLRFVYELQKATGTGGKAEPWHDPIPFNDYSLLPDFPVEVLPGVGREMVSAVSKVAQVDVGLTGSIYLSVLSACLGGKFIINLNSHKEPCNLYTASILPSGHRKTTVMADMARPLYEYQSEKQIESADVIRKAATQYKILETRLIKVQKQAANNDNTNQRMELINEADNISREMSNNPIPSTPYYICDDITNEALGKLMAQNKERMALMSAEGGIFKIMAGLYSERDGNFDLYLKAHSGDPWSNHRVGRDSQTMMSPALTMGLAIQPDVLEELGKNRQFRGRGLVARFLYSICKSQVGYRKRQTKAISDSLVKRYRDHIFTLMDIPSGYEVKLSTDAQLTWDEFYNDIESDMRPGGSLEQLEDWGSKIPGAVARIAGLLHFAKNGVDGIDMPISDDIVTGACTIGGYFKEHALAAFQQMGEDPRIKSAKKILSYVKREGLERFKGRDVLQHAYFSKRTMAEVELGLKILMERGYIRERKSEYSGRGRPEAITYDVNPKIRNL